MVNSRASLAALALAILLPALSSFVLAALPDYQIGDIVREDVIAPASSPSAASGASATIQETTTPDTPLVLRFNPKSPDESEVSLRAAVIMARYQFLRVFQEQLLGRKPTEADLGSPAYTRAIAEVSRNLPAHFPFDQLSPLWVGGQSEETLILTLAQPIRQAMANIIVENRGPAFHPEKPLRLITVKNLAMPLGIRDLDGPGLMVSPSKTITPDHARQLVENSFPATQPGLARFAATFVRANTQPDPAATALLEKRPRASQSSGVSNASGQILLRKGQIVDRQALETLASLREKFPGASFEPAPKPQPREQPLNITPVSQPRGQRPSADAFQLTVTDWTLITGIGGSMILIATVYWLKRARKSTTRHHRPLVRRARKDDITLVDDTAEASSRKRTDLAETRADRAHEAIRSGAFARLKEKFVSTLFRHRSELLAAQQKAQAEMEQLERRLEQLHAPLQQRIQAYEKRIAELEEKLADKGEINSHLLGARITLARQQLERSRFESN